MTETAFAAGAAVGEKWMEHLQARYEPWSWEWRNARAAAFYDAGREQVTQGFIADEDFHAGFCGAMYPGGMS